MTTLIAGAIHVLLAFYGLSRRPRSPLAVPVAVLNITFAGWTLAEAAYAHTGLSLWHYLDVAISPWVPVVGFWVVLVFVGETQRFRTLLRLLAASAVGFSLVAVIETWVPSLAWFKHSPWWGACLLGCLVVTLVVAVPRLVSHFRAQPDPRERARTVLVLLALASGSTFGGAQLMTTIGLPVPPLGHLASLSVAVFLTASATSFGLLAERTHRMFSVLSIAVAVLVGLSVLWPLRLALGSDVASSLAAWVLIGLLSYGAWVLVRERLRLQQRTGQLVFLGRVSDQMAHDLRNPVAAIKGASDVLQTARTRGENVDSYGDMFEVLVRESTRLEQVLDHYRQLASFVPRIDGFNLTTMVRDAVQAAQVHCPGIISTLEPDLYIHGDQGLLRRALDNVLDNAVHAMREGSRSHRADAAEQPVVVALSRHESWVNLKVKDRGHGMNPRVCSQAMEACFTTKEGGSGLGLPFARRVAEAHEGQLTVESVEGRGTTVGFVLPSPSAEGNSA